MRPLSIVSKIRSRVGFVRLGVDKAARRDVPGDGDRIPPEGFEDKTLPVALHEDFGQQRGPAAEAAEDDDAPRRPAGQVDIRHLGRRDGPDTVKEELWPLYAPPHQVAEVTRPPAFRDRRIGGHCPSLPARSLGRPFTQRPAHATKISYFAPKTPIRCERQLAESERLLSPPWGPAPICSVAETNCRQSSTPRT